MLLGSAHSNKRVFQETVVAYFLASKCDQQSSGARCAISQQQLLNCLDGIATQDGIVVVATANEPTALDPAILRRPGRFDRVVLFSNPNAELRLHYLRMLNSQLKELELRAAIDLSEGFSFAQPREVYILAGPR